MRLLHAIVILSAAVATGCASPRGTAAPEATSPTAMPAVKEATASTREADAAMTVIYKTNGDYADYVPVTLNPSRTAVVSFPAPGDLASGAPERLNEGFLLDNRGVNPNTAFTRWTYAEYAALPTAPTTEEILANIIPEARVTVIYRMPFITGTPGAADLCNKAIADGLKGCTKVFSVPTLTL